MRQRGFIPLPSLGYMLTGLAILVTLVAIAAAIFRAGERSTQVKWDAKIAADTKLEKARALDVSDAIKEKDAQRTVALERAAGADANWKEQAREARRLRKELASVVPAVPAQAQATAVAGDPAPGLRLHWRFVGLHDGAFTGPGGEPLFGASAQYAGAAERADAASPYGFDELIEVHGENARALSSCLRSFDDAVAKVRAAEVAWGKEK